MTNLYQRGVQWLKGFDADQVDNAAFRRDEQRAMQGDAREAQRAGIQSSITDGGRDLESVANEIQQILGRRVRRNEPDSYGQTRQGLVDSLYPGAVSGPAKARVQAPGALPEDFGTPAGVANLQQLLQSMGVGAQRAEGEVASQALVQLAEQIAAAKGVRQPGLGSMFHGAMAGINDQLATSGLARGAAYGGAIAGGVASVPLVTAAGQQLMALMQNLGDEQKAEYDSARGPQV